MMTYTHTIGLNSLRYVCPTLSRARARALAPALGSAMHEYDITTSVRAAAFIAQVAHETGEFQWLEEIWGPTATQAGYWRRLRDLGNWLPRHGKKFKGRGLIMVTGRRNYKAVSKALGVDFLRHPHRLAWNKYAALSGAWWWKAHGCNELASRCRFTDLTRVINGGTNGLDDRLEHYRRALQVAKTLVPRER